MLFNLIYALILSEKKGAIMALVRGFEDRFGANNRRKVFSPEFILELKDANSKVKTIEATLAGIRCRWSTEQIERERKRILKQYKPGEILEGMVQDILISNASFWMTTDLFWRALVIEFRSLSKK